MANGSSSSSSAVTSSPLSFGSEDSMYRQSQLHDEKTTCISSRSSGFRSAHQRSSNTVRHSEEHQKQLLASNIEPIECKLQQQQQLNIPKDTLKQSSLFLAHLKASQSLNFDNTATAKSSVDRARTSLSPSSVLQSIPISPSKNYSTRSNNRVEKLHCQDISSLRLESSREQLQSFLRNPVYKDLHCSPTRACDQSIAQLKIQPTRSDTATERTASIQAQPANFKKLEGIRRTQQNTIASTKKIHKVDEEDISDNTDSTADLTPFSTPYSSPWITNKPIVSVAEDDLVECASVESESTTSSFPSICSAGSGRIGITRPSYDIPSDDSFVYRPLVPPPPSLDPPTPKFTPSCNEDVPPASTAGDQITPKKRFTPTLNVNTSVALAAVSEEEEEEEEDESSAKETQQQQTSNPEESEEEVVFEQAAEEFSSPYSVYATPNNSYSYDLFDSPFASSDCKDEDEKDIFFPLQESKHKDLQKEGSICIEQAVDVQEDANVPDATMLSLIRNLSRNFNSKTTDKSICDTHANDRENSRSHSHSAGKKEKDKELKNHERKSLLSPTWSEMQSTTSLKSPSMDQSEHSVEYGRKANTIFLLLLEPKTKIFELIQLLYPTRTTTVHDIIKMIPRNATEKTLGNQAYVGLTRPKKKAVPIMDLNMLASNSVSGDGSSVESSSAGIRDGDVIVAIPKGSEHKILVSLAKQILANPHIQELVGIKDKDSVQKKEKEKKKKSKSNQGDATKSKTKHSKTRKTKDSDGNKKVHKHKSNKDKDSNKVETQHETHRNDHQNNDIPKSFDFASGNVFIPVERQFDENAFKHVADRYEVEMQRAIDRAARAESDRDFSLYLNPALSDGKAVNRTFTQSPTSMNTLFPHIEAFMLQREERSSSITSRDTRTTLDDNDSSLRESFLGNTADDVSFTGSLENSFNSWSRSFDSSVASRYCSSARTPNLTSTVISLTYVDLQSVGEPSSRVRRQRLFKTIGRFILCTTVFMAFRYFLDTEFGFMSATSVQQRATVPCQPLGVTGFAYFMIVFIALVKFQLFVQKSHSHQKKKQASAAICSKCPVMQMAYDICEVLSPKQ